MADANIKAEAEVVVNTSGIGDAVKKATTQANDAADKATKKSRKSQTDEAAKAAKEQERIAKKRADAEAKLLEKQAREEKRGQDAQSREYQRYQERLTRMHQDEVAKRIQREMDAERKSMATRKKEWQAFWKSTRGLARGVAAGAAAGAVVAASTSRSMAGIGDVQSRYDRALEFKQRFARVASQAKLTTEERAQVKQQIADASTASGKDQLETLSVLESQQAKFNDLRGAADSLKDMMVTAQGAGANADDLATALGRLKAALNLTQDQALREGLPMIVAAASAGSIEAQDMAEQFAPAFGVVAQNMGLKGVDGLHQILGMAQALGTLGATPAETATMMKRFSSQIGKNKTHKNLKRIAGIDVFQEDGVTMKAPGQILAEMATNKKLNARGGFEKVFGEGDILATEAYQAMRSAHERVQNGEVGAIDINTIADVKASSGRDIVQQSMSSLEQEGLLDAQRLAISVQQDTIDHFKLYNDQIVGVAKATEDLRIAMGDFGRTLGLWSSSVAAAGGGAAVNSMLGGGGGGGLLSSVGDLIGGTAAVKGVSSWLGSMGLGTGAGALGTAATWAGGVTAAGAGGYMIGQGIDAVSAWGREDGKSWSQRLEAMVNESIEAQRRMHESIGKSGPMQTVDVNAMVAEQRKTTQATRELASRIPQRPAPPVTGNRGAR